MMNAIETVVAVANDKLNTLRAAYCLKTAQRQSFGWAEGKTVEEIAAVLDRVNRAAYTLVIKDRRKYAAINTANSGYFMVDKTTGDVYGIKGYGQVHTGYHYGNVLTDPADAIQRMVNLFAVRL